MRGLLHSALLVAFVASITVGGLVVNLSPAAADTGGSFDPGNYGLSGDPLVQAAATAGNSSLSKVFSEGQATGILLNKIRYSHAWTAITARLGYHAPDILGDSSAAAQVGALEAKFAPIATKLAPAAKLIGKTSELAFAAQMGISLGASVDTAVGIDVAGGLCAGANDGVFSVVATILTFAGAADCEKYKMAAELQSLINKDAKGGLTGGKSCDPVGGGCFTLTGQVPLTQGSTTYAVYCFDVSAGHDAAAQVGLDWQLNGDGAARSTTSDAPGTGSASCGPTGFSMYLSNTAHLDFYCASAAASCDATVQVVPTVTAGDPDRTLRCDVTMEDGTVATASTAIWHESDKTIPPYKCPAVGATQVPTKTTVWETGGSNGDVKWMDVPTTPEYQADRKAHPDCTLGQCRLDLIRVADNLKCLDSGATCDGWFQDPNKATNYKCTLGPDPMPLQSCYAYAPTFNQQKAAAGTPYADPLTGTETGQTVPKAGDPATGADTKTGECFPTGWGIFNPVEWVYKPVVCAAQAVFLPKQSTIDTATTLVQTAWAESTPGKLQHEIEITLPPEFDHADTGCGGVLIDFPMWSASGSYTTIPAHILAACPGDYFAKWAPLFSFFIGGSFAIVGLLGIKRLLSALVGFHDPGIGG